MPLLALILILIAVVLFWLAHRRQKSSGLPSGRIIYADTRAWGEVEEPLYNRDLALTGRPDYLVKHGETYLPVEVKSTQVGAAPYDGHIFQLAAYCLLVESTFGVRPPYGILHYPNRTFAIDYTLELETALVEILEEMRIQDRLKQVPRSHENAGRCRRCGYRSICDQNLLER